MNVSKNIFSLFEKSRQPICERLLALSNESLKCDLLSPSDMCQYFCWLKLVSFTLGSNISKLCIATYMYKCFHFIKRCWISLEPYLFATLSCIMILVAAKPTVLSKQSWKKRTLHSATSSFRFRPSRTYRTHTAIRTMLKTSSVHHAPLH